MWGLLTEGATAYIKSNTIAHHHQGLYNPGLAEALGKARQAQGNDLPPTLKLILLVSSYMQEQYHGRMYAKAQNLRRSLRASYDHTLRDVDVSGDAHDPDEITPPCAGPGHSRYHQPRVEHVGQYRDLSM